MNPLQGQIGCSLNIVELQSHTDELSGNDFAFFVTASFETSFDTSFDTLFETLFDTSFDTLFDTSFDTLFDTSFQAFFKPSLFGVVQVPF